MKIHSLAFLALALPSVAVGQKGSPASAPPANGGTIYLDNQAPTISADLPDRVTWGGSGALRFTVTVTDPEGEDVTLKLLNPPRGLFFEPLVNQPSPATAKIVWYIGDRAKRHHLVFEATDGTNRTVEPVVSDILALPTTGRGIMTGDVTGDGVEDVVAIATRANVGGVQDTGAAYVWLGKTSGAPNGAPAAKLVVPGADENMKLGETGANGLQLVDVTGDGLLDIVIGAELADPDGALNAGAIYVWKGRTSLANVGGELAPDATLYTPNSSWLFMKQLGRINYAQGIVIDDVTGDGQVDVIAGASLADVNGVDDTGVICVWEGGSGLDGVLEPVAILAVPGAAAEDQLGDAPGLLVADVTGDGYDDLVALAYRADVGGVVDAGAIYVWSGGPGLTGALAPFGTLAVPGAVAEDNLGLSGLQLQDVTGDGTLDIVACSSSVDLGALEDAGAIYVWSGGSALGGTPAPQATLTQPAGGDAALWSLMIRDFTQDGVLDVFAIAPRADAGGVEEAGAIYLWPGGAGLSGASAPTATFFVPGATALDQLSVGGVKLADLTGDGQPELLSSANWADVGGISNAGAVYVFPGSASVSGSIAPVATLTIPASTGIDPERLGGVLLGDVTGDGRTDVVVSHSKADFGPYEEGRVHVWSGAQDFVGSPLPQATLEGLGNGTGGRLYVADVTGDGVLDIVDANWSVSVLSVWKGGAALSGDLYATATLKRVNPSPDDRLGDPSTQFQDLTGDGVLDLVVGARWANITGINSGSVFFWKGGPGLSGTPAFTARFQSPNGKSYDQLGSNTAGEALPIVDMNGDGVLDLLAGTFLFDYGGVPDTGAIQLWYGSPGLTGLPLPVTTFFVPGATLQDQLGF